MSDEVPWSEVEYLASTTDGDIIYRTAARVARLALAERERADGWAQTAAARCEPHIERAERAEAEVERLRERRERDECSPTCAPHLQQFCSPLCEAVARAERVEARAERAESEVERLREGVDERARVIRKLDARCAETVKSYHDFIEELSLLIPEGDDSKYANPEGSAESIIVDCFRAYRAERDELQCGYDAAVEQVESEMDKRIKAEAERDEWKRRRDNAVETCRFRHQEGLTAREWHARICGAMQGVERVEAERDEARAEVERRENARLAATVERDHLRAAVAALADALATGTADFMAAYAEAGEGFSTRMSGESAALVVQIRTELEAELRALLDDPDAALRAVKAQALREAADALEWVRPEVSPCDHPEDCCGSEASCDAMQPAQKVVGQTWLRESADRIEEALMMSDEADQRMNRIAMFREDLLELARGECDGLELRSPEALLDSLITDVRKQVLDEAVEAIRDALSGDEYEDNCRGAASEGEWSWWKWLATTAVANLRDGGEK